MTPCNRGRIVHVGSVLAYRGIPSNPHTAPPSTRYKASATRRSAETTVDELGLSSLERIELMTALEEQFDTTIDEAAFSGAKTIGDLEALVQQASSLAVRALEAGRADVQRAPPSETITFPVWNRRGRARSSSCEFSGLDPASCARVHVDSGIRTRASADDRRPGDLCGQSSEPPGYTSHS